MPDIKDLVPYFQVYAPVVITVGTAIAMWAILQNIAINQRNKRADCIFHCNNRYDEIYKYKSSILDKQPINGGAAAAPPSFGSTAPTKSSKAKAQPDEAKHYYARYWGLKSDEFDYWLAKLIDLDTIINWAFLTVKAFRENPSIVSGGISTSFRQGWLQIGLPDNVVTNPWFTEFTTVLYKLGERGIQDPSIELKVLLDLFDRIERESRSYRRTLQNEMTVKSYRKTRRKKEKLELMEALQASLNKHHLIGTTQGEHI